MGSYLPLDEVQVSKQQKKKEVWVRGVAYAPALHVRKFNNIKWNKVRGICCFHSRIDEDQAEVKIDR